MSCTRKYVPVPLLVDLREVDAVADDAAAAGEEQHVAVGAPELVGECPEGEEDEQEEEPLVRAPALPRPGRHGLAHQRPVQGILPAIHTHENEPDAFGQRVSKQKQRSITS